MSKLVLAITVLGILVFSLLIVVYFMARYNFSQKDEIKEKNEEIKKQREQLNEQIEKMSCERREVEENISEANKTKKKIRSGGKSSFDACVDVLSNNKTKSN